MSGAYYNDNDPKAAAWLRELIKGGHIAAGEVDERSIADVRAEDLAGFDQCHFFAGIGGWSYALRLARWPDDRPVWTGSCPCQPFSVAGKGEGHEDKRHLWPTWFGLIRESRPVSVFGEQVADGDGPAWLDHVGHDMESIGYALGAVSTAACGFGCPGERQRLYFVADAECGAPERHGLAVGETAGGSEGEGHQRERLRIDAGDGINARSMAYAESGGQREFWSAVEPGHIRHAYSGVLAHGVVNTVEPGLEGHGRHGGGGNEPGRVGAYPAGSVTETGGTRGLADSDRALGSRRIGNEGNEGGPRLEQRPESDRRSDAGEGRPGPLNGRWADADWLLCRDGKWRPVESGTFPLAHGIPARMGRLRGYGNAIVPQVAAEFIKASL